MLMSAEIIFNRLQDIFFRPEPFSVYTTGELWTDDYTSQRMLENHLDGASDLSSRGFDFIDRSVDWMINHFNIKEDISVADFGCGPGLYTSRLAKTGARVTGIDFSLRSIEYARQYAASNNLNIRYIHQDYLNFESFERFDLITMIYCDYSALSPSQRKTMLDKFASLLTVDGKILLDVHSCAGFDLLEESAICGRNLMNGFWSPRDYFGFKNTFKYPDVKVSLDKYTLIEEDRIRTIYNWLQYFDRDSIRAEFEQSGLKIESFPGDVAGGLYSPESPVFAVIASLE